MTPTYAQRILRAQVYLQERLDDDVSLDRLAQVAGFSPYHFHRIFRGMVGEPVKTHVRRLRLERAAQQLRRGDRTVLDIALDAGFDSHEGFTRAFRETFGLNPSDYRAEARPAPEVVPLEVQITERKQTPVLFLRHTGPYAKVGATFERLIGYAFSQGWMRPNTEILGIVHDDPEITPPDKLRFDAAVSIPHDIPPRDDFGRYTIAAGRYAVTRYHGPYNAMSDTYARFCGQWFPSQGLEVPAAPAIELYRNNPRDVPPERLITDICLPLSV